jgi:penicillin-binding protein 1A
VISLVRTLLAGISILFVAACILVAATVMSYLQELSPTLPDLSEISSWRPSEGTKIVAADGSLLGVHSRQQRQFAAIDGIPKIVVDAFVAAEDRNYWRHSGIDPTALVRAALGNLRRHAGERPEGGSTITQQVVKNLVVGSERTMSRKVREAILAMRADRHVGKKRMLEIYLNEIYLGSGAYGVAAAAKVYFGKSLDELVPAEAAVLAGLPKSPGGADPNKNLERATERRNYVLGRMRADNVIPEEVYRTAVSTQLRVVPIERETSNIAFANWYADEEIRRRLLVTQGSERFYGKGGVVESTIRPEMQALAHSSLRKGLVREDRRDGWKGPLARGVKFPINWNDDRLSAPKGAEDWRVGVVSEVGAGVKLATKAGFLSLPAHAFAWTGRARGDQLLRQGDVVLVGDLGGGYELQQIPDVQGAVVMLDPKTGDVLSLVGGFSGENSKFNRATQARRQTGSAFKPFVYLSAIELGYDGTSPVLDAPVVIEQGPGQKDWRPQDASGGGLGLITLRKSLELSRNMSTVRLLLDIGIDAARSTASRAGFNLPDKIPFSMALGALEASPLEVASAYATIANAGTRMPYRFLKKEETVASPVIDPVPASQITSILRGVVSEGTARRAFSGFSRPLAAKTGTTNGARDVWFVAYGPRIVIATWIGRDDFRPLHKGASGGGTAAPIAREILDGIGDENFDEFPLPAGAEEVTVDGESGQRSEKGRIIEIVKDAAAARPTTDAPTAEMRSRMDETQD